MSPILLLVVALVSVPGALSAQAPAILLDHAPSALPGGVLVVGVTGEAIASAEGSVTFADGAAVRSRGWAIDDPATEEPERWVMMFGVPTTIGAGEATLTVTARRDDGTTAAGDGVFIVEAREFRRENIALTGALSDLRTTEDPRRAEESRVLWELLQTFNARARHHSGRLVLPLTEIRRTSLFGDRRVFLYADGNSADAIHYGVDFAAPIGTPILAPANGRVAMATDRLITGKTVVLEHLPGVYTLYYHLDELSVAPNDIVTVGESIGTVGSTGLSTGPHLHWELRVSGVAVDPEANVDAPLVDTGALGGSLSTSP
ncbi:MAG: M23 family metallopeptidase [Spirochaetales bacterium]|nr:M23 family metallopeptidase [Spirochaetales bacterium]